MPLSTGRFRHLIGWDRVDLITGLNNYLYGQQADKQAFIRLGFIPQPPIDGITETLESLVAIAVCAELHRLSDSRILYQTIGNTPAELAAALAPANIADAVAGDLNFEPDPNITHIDAFSRYERYVLGRNLPASEEMGEHGQNGEALREAFFERNPVTRYYIELKKRFFIANIQQACDRIYADRDIIRRVFFDQANIRLEQITSTGSDSHKRGKQVLILEFVDTDSGQTHRLIYKPSDVEIDFKVMAPSDGNDPLVDFLHDQVDNPRYPNPQDSLTTLINHGLLKTNQDLCSPIKKPIDFYELPTYRVLPINPGSHAQNLNEIDVEQAYGYIEYLRHQPDAPPVGTRVNLLHQLLAHIYHNPDRYSDSDWVTQDRHRAKAFRRLWGRTISFAFLIGTTDVHPDNQRVARQKPTLIDLESSFESVQSLSASSIDQFYNYLRETSSVIRVWENTPEDLDKVFHSGEYSDLGANKHIAGVIRTSILRNSLTYTPLIWSIDVKYEYSKNSLFLYAQRTDGEGFPLHVNPKIRAVQPEVMRGIQDVLRLLRNQGTAQKLIEFVKYCSNAVVRHVPVGTAQFYRTLWHGYERMLLTGTSAGSPPLNAAELRTAMQTQICNEAAERINQERSAWQQNRTDYPTFVLESPGNSWADYLNFDIPFYFRRLGQNSQRIFNSAGTLINLAGAIDAQENTMNATGHTAANTNPVTQYFSVHMPQTGVETMTAFRDLTSDEFTKVESNLLFVLYHNQYRCGQLNTHTINPVYCAEFEDWFNDLMGQG